MKKKNQTIKFTKRQREIMLLWAELGSAAAVAQTLGISIHTVQTQMKRMRKRLGVKRSWMVYEYITKNQKK